MDDKLIASIDITEAGIYDAGQITALVNSVYRGEESKKGWTTEAYFLDGVRITCGKVKEIINSKNNTILLFKQQNSIIGCVHLEKDYDICWLGMLSVNVNYQSHGLGRYIISKSETYAMEIFKCTVMKMKVISVRKELIDYYLRRGYSLTGESELFSSSKDTFGKPSSSQLTFIMLKKPLF